MLAGEVDLDLFDESCDVPKPLVVALDELGQSAQGIVRILREFGAEGDADEYYSESRSLPVIGLGPLKQC